MSNKQISWYLERTSLDDAGKWTIEIYPTPFKIGRTDENNLVLRSKWVSRNHAEINLSGNMLWIRDLGSTNGTYVNHHKITEATEITKEDTINFGRTELIIKQDTANPIDSDSTKTYLLDMTKELEITNLAFRLEPELRSLIKNKAVLPHYQSIVDLQNSQVAGYEILGRINGGIGLPNSPKELFDVASYLNLAIELSELFRLEGAALWREKNHCPLLFFNTHPAEIEKIDTLERSLEKLRKTVPNAPIVLEIHEKAVPSISQLQRLRDILYDLEIQLAYDDFGVGQTRLVELSKIPPDYLKFDISIIRNIHLAPKSLHQMVLTFVKASNDLGIAPLAEGIEKIEEHEKCRELGFQYAQGFFYSNPAMGSDLFKQPE